MGRFVAGALDLVVVVALGALPEGLGLIEAAPGTWISSSVAAAAVAQLPLLLARGTTPGKLATGLRVVTVDGGRLASRPILARWSLVWAPVLLVAALDISLLAVAAYWLVLTAPSQVTARHQGVHDLLVGSVVTADPPSALVRGGRPPLGMPLVGRRRTG